MRLLIGLAALLVCASGCDRREDRVQGIPAYSTTRSWIERHCTTNALPQDERVFIGHDTRPEYAGIVRYRMGITLREIIDQTPFRNTTATVYIMGPTNRPGNTDMGEFFTVSPTEKPEFEVKPLDVIWIWVYDGVPVVQ